MADYRLWSHIGATQRRINRPDRVDRHSRSFLNPKLTMIVINLSIIIGIKPFFSQTITDQNFSLVHFFSKDGYHHIPGVGTGKAKPWSFMETEPPSDPTRESGTSDASVDSPGDGFILKGHNGGH